jgi:site-specific recombinase XerD
LHQVELCGCTNLKKADAALFYNVFLKTTTSTLVHIVKPFLKYAFCHNLTEKDFSILVQPQKHVTRIPAVYSPEEVESVLLSADYSAPFQKRNTAVVLIAARLGLRACDISALTFDNIDFDKNFIRIVQVKTKIPLALPLSEDVKASLQDYIANERPISDDPHIFMNRFGTKPMSTGAVSSFVPNVFKKSSVSIYGRRHGPHSLRTSLATALLHEGNDYRTIQKVLGHNDIQSTKTYARANIEELRTCAMAVPLPTGRFEKLLSERSAANEK